MLTKFAEEVEALYSGAPGALAVAQASTERKPGGAGKRPAAKVEVNESPAGKAWDLGDLAIA